MGLPMARRLIQAGFAVRGADAADGPRRAIVEAGGMGFADAVEAADGADMMITMLPNGGIVRDVLLMAGAARALTKGAFVIDMSSSAPTDTVSLAANLEPLGLALIDAPVSGGVKRAIDASLAIMAGGPVVDVLNASTGRNNSTEVKMKPS